MDEEEDEYADLRAKPFWFGYDPAERVLRAKDLVLDVVGTHDLDLVDDETWMDVIAEDTFDRRLPRSAHGTSKGGSARCECFLCVEWRVEEARRSRIEEQKVLALEHPRHPLRKKWPKVR